MRATHEDLNEKPDPRSDKKPYHTPAITYYGDLRSVTLGGSPLATFDSGDGIPGKRPV